MDENEPVQLMDLATIQDYDVLRELSVGKKCVFEFGSFIGGSAAAMLPQIKEADGHLYCVDHLRGNQNDPYTDVSKGAMMAGFFLRTDPYEGFVTLIIGSTSEVLNFPSGFADMVFIDASHSYCDVVVDICYARHLLKDGGIICGHDYIRHLEDCDPEEVEKWAYTSGGGNDGICYGVIKAVNDTLKKPNHKERTAIWWMVYGQNEK